MDLGNLLFSYKGRINRAKYWLAILIYFIVSIVALIIIWVVTSEAVAQMVNSVVSVVTFISGILVGIKRLHDRDKSGWWLLLFYIAPTILILIGVLVVFIMGIYYGFPGAWLFGGLCGLAAAGITIWAFVELGCLRGTVGPNQYGPDPLAPEAAVAVR